MNPAAPSDLFAATWRKSTRSSGGGSNCIEVARLPGRIAIRDSKNPDGPALLIALSAFRELTDALRRGACNA